MKIYLYYQNQISVFYLPESVSGSYSFDPNEEETSKLINIDAKEGKWILFKTNDCKLLDGSSYVNEIVIEVNKFYMINRFNINYLIYIAESDEKNIRVFNYSDSINLSIGGQGATINYTCPYVKGLALKIAKQNNQLTLQYNQGYIYINKNRLNSQSYFIKNGDEFEMFGIKILFLSQMIIVIADPNLLQINTNTAGLIETQLKNHGEIEDKEIKDKELYDENSYFSKSPRLRRTIEEKEIELSQPPQQENDAQQLPMILTAGPMLTMGITSMMTMVTTIAQLASGSTDLKNVWPQLVTGIAMAVSTLLWPLLTNFYNKRSRAKRNKELNEKYEKYLAEKKLELENERKLQSEIIKENVISIDNCLENLKHRGLNFWDKRIDQSDFLVARIGIGNELLKVKINYPEKGFSADEDELKKRVEKMVEEYKYINNVPIGYSFYENNVTAIMGDDVKCHYFMNNILFQLLTFYSYDDLKLVVFTNPKNEKYWDYIKYLNHNMTNDSSFRFFASNEETAANVANVLKQEINNRKGQESEDKATNVKPYYLLVIDDLEVVKKTNLVEELTELKDNLGFSIIILEKKLSKLPSLCNNFINIGDKTSGILKNSYEKQEQLLFTDEINYKINMMDVARILANIPIEISSNDEQYGELPDAITFLEMAKVGKVEQLNIMNRWNTNDSKVNLKAEVGVGTDGKLMYLDLHEKAHGPHGLIAGMTGSGKSEFIITWILSLAMNFSPEDVAFILIDYKGGGLAFAFENQTTGTRLPHLTGTITNLDKAEINRTLVSIDSEVKRRQRIFNEARDQLGESTIDIYKYQGFFHEGKLTEPLPHLFIVCDEFAELKAQQPDFMDNLISVARIGRSLGVHLILATQKPSGVVNDQIWSNTKFRVCLKVQDASDSNEMLKRPDAASLKQTGRFYLQVGYDEYFALGQSGWCGAKYYPSDVIQKTVDKSINIIEEDGIVVKSLQSGSDNNKKVAAEGEQLSAIMNEIIKVAKESNRFAKRLWLENIPEVITISGVEKKYNITYEKNNFGVVIGEYDAPEKQEQAPLIYNLLTDGNTNIISSDSQEYEKLVTTILYNIVKHYQPNEVSYYIIDYGSQNFQKFSKDPHCGGVVTPGDNESMTNLIKLLQEEQKSRKKILSEAGCEYTDYIKQNPGKMPILITILNNYESIYESNEFLYEMLGELLRDSDRYGIVYIITSSLSNSVPDRYKQLMPCTYALKLKDSSEYSYLFNVKGKIEPRNVFGRGICLNETLHEFQTASICEDRSEESKALVTLFDELNKQGIECVLRIPTLPEQVMFKDVSKRLKGIKRMPIGIEKGSLVIRTLNLTADIGKIVLSSKMKYLKSFINSFVDEVKETKENLIILDAAGEMPFLSEKTKNYIDKVFDEAINKIMEFIEQSKQVPNKNNVIIINSIGRLFEKLEDSSKLNELFQKCRTAGNSYIVVFDEMNKVRDLAYEEWFKSIDVSEGIYIGPGVEDQSVLKIANYSRELSQSLPKNYGYYIAEGSFHIVKLIEFERMEESEDDEE